MDTRFRRCLMVVSLIGTVGCSHRLPTQPNAGPPDMVVSRILDFRSYCTGRQSALRHGVLVTERSMSDHAVIVSEDGSVTTIVETAPGSRSTWIGKQLPGIYVDDGPRGSTIYGIATDGSGRRSIVHVEYGHIHTPMTSRDGQTFVFFKETDDSLSVEVYRTNAGHSHYTLGPNLSRQTPATYLAGSISDDGQWLAFSSYGYYATGMWLMSLENGRVYQKSTNLHYRPAFSPDRTRLVFSEGSGGTGAIVLSSASLRDSMLSGPWERLAGCYACFNEPAYLEPAFSTDGLFIYCLQQRSNQSNLISIGPNGHQISDGRRSYFWPSVQ